MHYANILYTGEPEYHGSHKISLYLFQTLQGPALLLSCIKVTFISEQNRKTEEENTYSTGDSLVVTDLATDPALAGLSMRERTSPRISQQVQSYMSAFAQYVL